MDAVMIPGMTTRAEELAAERSRFEATWGPSPWQRLCPPDLSAAPVLAAIEGHLGRDETRAEVERCELEEAYPDALMNELHGLGLPRILAEEPGADPEASLLTPYHVTALAALVARRASCSLAITVGINSLSLLPAYVGADPAQLEAIFARVRDGARCGILLTELAHGSNLLRTEAQAEPGVLAGGAFRPARDDEQPTHYRLSGEKELINGGNEHELLFCLVRTRPPRGEGNLLRARSELSVFWVRREDGVVGLPRWRTMPAHAADIGGARLDGVVVPAERILQGEGRGFSLVRNTLAVSRGGVAALASGTLSRARDLARAYAAARDVYGAPIHTLGAIQEHLLKLEALDRVVACLSLKATAMTNAAGLGAIYYTGVAKLMGSELAEEGVREGAKVLGARALLRDLPYERVRRDVLLFGVFDGTTHVMLDELAGRLSEEVFRWAGRSETRITDPLGEARRVYAAPPARFLDVLRGPTAPLVLPLPEHLRALAALPGARSLEPLADLAEALYDVVRSLRQGQLWDGDQSRRFQAAGIQGLLEALTCTVELSDPDRRQALGLPTPREADAGLDAAVYGYTVGWLGDRVATRIRALAASAGIACPPSLEGIEERLLADEPQHRAAFAAALVGSS